MAKVYTRGAKRRAKKAMPELAATPRREKSGRHQRETKSRDGVDRDPDRVALKARAAAIGSDDWRDGRHPMLAEHPGQCLWLACAPDEARALWDAYDQMTRAEAIYHRRVIGMSVHAKCARIEHAIERFETRADDRPDLRSDDERDRAARVAWDTWDRCISRLPLGDAASIRSAARGWAVLVQDAAVTVKGGRFVAAMKKLLESAN